MIAQPDHNSMNLLDAFDALIEWELGAAEADALMERLRDDEAVRLAYVEYLDVHLELLRLVGHEESLQGASFNSIAKQRTSDRMWTAAAAAVAAVLLVGLVGLWAYWSPTEERVAVIPPRPVAEADESPPVVLPVVATLSYDPDGTEWVDGPLDYQDGMELREGDAVAIVHGIAEVRFHSGAMCVLAGETPLGAGVLTLTSDNSCTLDDGSAAFVVPQGAEGFEVNTASGRVVDLGTEFGVSVRSERVAEVHVIDGLVQAAAHRGDVRLEVREGAAAALDVRTNVPYSVPFRPEEFEVPISFVHGVRHFSSSVVYHPRAPGSLLREDVGHFDEASLIAERTDVTLTGELRVRCPAVRRSVPGRANAPAGGDVFRLPAGLRVDSYFVHCSWSDSGIRRPTSGEIRFRRPIVAVIGDVKELASTTPAFGLPGREYPSSGKGYGLEVGQNFEDRVMVSADRRTIRFRLSAADQNIDQMRVLVAAEDQPVQAAAEESPTR